MNPTLIGLIAVIVWGASLPFTRLFEQRIGILAMIGIMYAGTALLGLIRHFVRRATFPDKKIFRNPFLYGRWIFFALHEVLIMCAIVIVRRHNVPFVILINYLWPTAIILCSVLFAGVKIEKWWALILGSVIVFASIAIEVLGARGVSVDLFEDPTDRLAYLMALIGAVSWGLYCALSRRAGEATGGSSVIPLFQLTLALALPFSFMPGYATWNQMTGWWPIFLAIYCIFQFVAYLSWDFGMRKGNIVALSLCADFIPWLSLVTLALLLHVRIEIRTMAAAVLLVTGAMITRYGTLQKKASRTITYELPEV